MRKTTSGFTVVELIIVVSVIAILVTVTAVAYNGVQQRSAEVAVRGDLRTIARLISQYRMDNGGVYPYDPVPPVDAFDNSSTIRNQLQTLNMKVNANAYRRDSSNALYVSNLKGDQWYFLAIPKGGTASYVSNSNVDPKPYTQAYPNCFPGCDARDVGFYFGIPRAEVTFYYVHTTANGFRIWN